MKTLSKMLTPKALGNETRNPTIHAELRENLLWQCRVADALHGYTGLVAGAFEALVGALRDLNNVDIKDVGDAGTMAEALFQGLQKAHGITADMDSTIHLPLETHRALISACFDDLALAEQAASEADRYQEKLESLATEQGDKVSYGALSIKAQARLARNRDKCHTAFNEAAVRQTRVRDSLRACMARRATLCQLAFDAVSTTAEAARCVVGELQAADPKGKACSSTTGSKAAASTGEGNSDEAPNTMRSREVKNPFERVTPNLTHELAPSKEQHVTALHQSSHLTTPTLDSASQFEGPHKKQTPFFEYPSSHSAGRAPRSARDRHPSHSSDDSSTFNGSGSEEDASDSLARGLRACSVPARKSNRNRGSPRHLRPFDGEISGIMDLSGVHRTPFPSPEPAKHHREPARFEDPLKRIPIPSKDVPDRERFIPGQRVRLLCLQERPDLNGQEGTITTWDDDLERWKVRMDDGSGKLFKTKNLEAACNFHHNGRRRDKTPPMSSKLKTRRSGSSLVDRWWASLSAWTVLGCVNEDRSESVEEVRTENWKCCNAACAETSRRRQPEGAQGQTSSDLADTYGAERRRRAARHDPRHDPRRDHRPAHSPAAPSSRIESTRTLMGGG